MIIKVYSNQASEVQKYWGNNMSMKTMEECGELIKAISKYETGDGNDSCVLEEMADVIIAIAALANKYMIGTMEIQSRINDKLERKYE